MKREAQSKGNLFIDLSSTALYTLKVVLLLPEDKSFLLEDLNRIIKDNGYFYPSKPSLYKGMNELIFYNIIERDISFRPYSYKLIQEKNVIIDRLKDDLIRFFDET